MIKHAFAEAKDYAWVLYTQVRDLHKASFDIITCTIQVGEFYTALILPRNYCKSPLRGYNHHYRTLKKSILKEQEKVRKRTNAHQIYSRLIILF